MVRAQDTPSNSLSCSITGEKARTTFFKVVWRKERKAVKGKTRQQRV